jgi:hypothetical protein
VRSMLSREPFCKGGLNEAIGKRFKPLSVVIHDHERLNGTVAYLVAIEPDLNFLAAGGGPCRVGCCSSATLAVASYQSPSPVCPTTRAGHRWDEDAHHARR